MPRLDLTTEKDRREERQQRVYEAMRRPRVSHFLVNDQKRARLEETLRADGTWDAYVREQAEANESWRAPTRRGYTGD